MLLEHVATLLEYPTASFADACAAARADAAAECPPAAGDLGACADATAPLRLVDLQELYTRTFDFDADTALYLGHHLFGEDGRRGLLIAGLTERCQRLQIRIGVELADHLAPVLRSLAVERESEEAREIVRLAVRPVLAKVLPTVERRASPYAAVLRALTAAIAPQGDEPFESGSDRCRSSSSPYFLTLLS
jgi:nitrate reductase delta subunit